MTKPIIYKTCRECKKEKLRRYFCKVSQNRDGRNNTCKKCVSRKSKERRKVKDLTIKTSDVVRFFSKVEKTDACWVWMASKLPKGYGHFYLNGCSILAHRFSYLHHFGHLPQDLDVLHRCDNASCVNPRHLFLGTNQDNIEDMIAKGRNSRGEKVNWAKITTADVVKIRQRHSSGESDSFIAKDYPITRKAVNSIVRRITWKHVE